MQYLDVALEDPRWEAVDLDALAETAITQTLEHLSVDPEISEISLLACDDARIAELNADFRGRQSPTNVLSWPSDERAPSQAGGEPQTAMAGPDGLIELGDIAISYDTCMAEARSAQKPVTEHVTHLLVHATLHLLGYDHETELDAAVMEQLEVKILGKMGLDDPYRSI